MWVFWQGVGSSLRSIRVEGLLQGLSSQSESKTVPKTACKYLWLSMSSRA